jgi:hypothetical protein
VNAITALNLCRGRHAVDDMPNLLEGRSLLFPLGGRDAGVLVGEIEVVGVGIAKAGLVSRLPGQPMEKPFELREGGI